MTSTEGATDGPDSISSMRCRQGRHLLSGCATESDHQNGSFSRIRYRHVDPAQRGGAQRRGLTRPPVRMTHSATATRSLPAAALSDERWRYVRAESRQPRSSRCGQLAGTRLALRTNGERSEPHNRSAVFDPWATCCHPRCHPRGVRERRPRRGDPCGRPCRATDAYVRGDGTPQGRPPTVARPCMAPRVIHQGLVVHRHPRPLLPRYGRGSLFRWFRASSPSGRVPGYAKQGALGPCSGSKFRQHTFVQPHIARRQHFPAHGRIAAIPSPVMTPPAPSTTGISA